MTTPVPVALPWYRREEYPILRTLISDPDKLPKTFDAWLERAEQVEKQLEATGFAVVRVRISPAPFAAWCKERQVLPDQHARLTFANEAASEHRCPPD